MAYPQYLEGKQSGVDAVPITPHDSNTFAPCRGFMIGTGGTLVFLPHNGVERTVTVPAGWWPVGGTLVKSTGTTATGITAIY